MPSEYTCKQCDRVHRTIDTSDVEPRNLVISHVLSILNLPRLERRSSMTRLWRFVDRLQLHFDVLRQLNYHLDTWGDALTGAVASKLRGPIKELWDLTAGQYRRESRPLVVSLLIEFLWQWCEPMPRNVCDRNDQYTIYNGYRD